MSITPGLSYVVPVYSNATNVFLYKECITVDVCMYSCFTRMYSCGGLVTIILTSAAAATTLLFVMMSTSFLNHCFTSDVFKKILSVTVNQLVKGWKGTVALNLFFGLDGGGNASC